MRCIGTVIVAVLLAGETSSAETFTVLANNVSFAPDALDVSPGDTIIWQYNSGYPHTVTSGSGCIPDGQFNSPLDGNTPTFTWEVPEDASGDIAYFCLPHCDSGMVGTISIITDDCVLTRPDVEGPYWIPGSPERSDLREAGDGPLLDLHIEVVDRDCLVVSDAWIDIWHADPDGAYDKAGWSYRGYHWTDAGGTSLLETVVPGLYPGRTRHIHVKVQGETSTVFTTQLYFPDVPENDSDFFYHPDLEVTVVDEDAAGNMVATFRFVLDESVTEACPADLDGDGTVGVDDILLVLALFNSEDPAGDATGDGLVDVNDILVIIGAWGECP